MRKSKIILGVLMAGMILTATGCGSKEKKLVCTQSESGVDIEFNVGFKGKVIKTMDFNYDMDLSDYSDEQIATIEEQDFCSIVKESMSDYKDAFTDCEEKVSDKHLKINSVLDINKIADNVLDKMASPEDAKKELESQGYKCTLE